MKKKVYFRPLVIVIILFLILRFPYRNYIYNNQIFDFYIADTSPNFLAIFMCVFFERMTSKHNDGLLMICLIILGAILTYEIIIQPYLFAQTYDSKDIIASFLSLPICFFICKKIENLDMTDALAFKIDFNKLK